MTQESNPNPDLPSHPRAKKPQGDISFLQLFRYATLLDKVLIVIGTILSIVNGAAMPLLTIIFSDAIQAFATFTLSVRDNGFTEAAGDDLYNAVISKVKLFIMLGVAVFSVSYKQIAIWMIVGERQAKRVRQKYYEAILRQDMSFFDSVSTGDVTTRISSDINLFQEGISEKVGLIVQYVSTFITGFVIGFTKGWKLTLVLCSVFPLLAITGGLMGKLLAASTRQGQDAYAAAGSVAEQVLSGIRTVTAFGGQERELRRYVSKLQIAYLAGRKKAIITGVSLASLMFIVFCTFALAFWYGSILVVDGQLSGGQVLNVFFAVLIGAISIGNASPNISSIGNALGAAKNLFSVIDRVPVIDSTDPSGKRITKSSVKGRLEFRNIDFYYPSRPDVQVLKNFNLDIEAGQTIALVGGSGSGKSTIVGLLERFYNPTKGQIFLDGENINDINIKSLRAQIGLVGQEPVLFPESIRQNIAWGTAPDTPEADLDEIIEACKKSNAHEFINDLPNKYDTKVGEKGSLMSGGQKQRIAIARALIKDPPILLLDEATSALDTESERLVQEALDAASSNRTTIVIAHRLSTIKNADKIVVMSKGEILEVGRHEELIFKRGVYYGLVQAQELKVKNDASKSGLFPEDEEDDDLLDDGDNNEDMKITIEDEKRPGMALRKVSTKASTIKSIKSVEEIIEEESKEKVKQSAPFTRVFKLQRPEYLMMFFGAISAAVNGAIMPLFSIIFATLLDVLSKTDRPHELRHDANFWALMFLLLAIASFLANFFQNFSFIISGEKLTKRLRTITFEKLLKQDIGYFDDERNSTGVLTSKLAIDASRVEGLTGTLMGSILQTGTNMIAGMAIAFAYGWKLALVVLAITPTILISGYINMKSLAGFGAKTAKAYEESGRIVQQSVSNIRTIASLTRENTFKDLYKDSIRKPHRIALKGSIVSSIGFGLSQGSMFFVYALAFWYGERLIEDQEYDMKQMMKVLFAVIFSAIAAGQASTFAPNSAKAKIAALSIFEILDHHSRIDPTQNEGKDRPTPVTGSANIQDAYFNYPARPNMKILRGLKLSISPGQTVALVGGSGSGKSTVISLLLRFYDVRSGEVNMEDVNVKQWNLEYLRRNMALVGQEPVLFDLTIGENIAYGKEGCTQEEIVESAKNANIHTFISSLPEGYNTPVGERGTQLSGGQKQRIAIARALIRNPKLLLLDEATSALDSESEKVVQDALDRASAHRTTITIAHRLSTIQNADLILVVKKGRVVEQGKHFDLIAARGLYYDLVNRQTLGVNGGI
ncbi:17258_t:CDS:10 [Acaulospora morrowiae]|uniref:17258_t:CDS:1 n=1 Tax=Acaulospora morrowiae TaxID=94023 RepID=A0A9N8V9N0_9GLOM|nr:17258_t:CDS:10 [Acaulospora morrowiae]